MLSVSHSLFYLFLSFFGVWGKSKISFILVQNYVLPSSVKKSKIMYGLLVWQFNCCVTIFIIPVTGYIPQDVNLAIERNACNLEVSFRFPGLVHNYVRFTFWYSFTGLTVHCRVTSFFIAVTGYIPQDVNLAIERNACNLEVSFKFPGITGPRGRATC